MFRKPIIRKLVRYYPGLLDVQQILCTLLPYNFNN